MTATVTASLVPGWYQVRDQSGRTHRASSQERWRRGERVTIIDGVIVGRAGKAPRIETYEV